MTELLAGTKKGLFVLRGRAGRAVRGDRPRVRRRARRVRAARPALRPRPRVGHVAVLRARRSGTPTTRPASGSRPRASSSRPAATPRSSASGCSCPARPTARSTPAATPACCSRAATAARRSSSTARSGSSPTRDRWQPGAGGLCLHSIVPWPGDPSRLAIGDLRRRRVADRRRRRDVAARQRGASSRATCPRSRRPTRSRCACTSSSARAARPERIFMQFHGGVYRSDDAGRDVDDIADGLPSDFGFPLAVDPADPDSAYVIPLVADVDRVTPDGRVRVYETRDAGASWAPRGDGLPVVGRVPHGPARGDRPGRRRARRSSSTSARRRARSSGRATRARAGSRWRRTCRRCMSVAGAPASGSSTLHRRCRRPAATRPRAGRRAPRPGRSRPCKPAAGGVGAADPVVADLHAEAAVARRLRSTKRVLGVRVLGDVGERLGRDEVRGGLDRRRRPARTARR